MIRNYKSQILAGLWLAAVLLVAAVTAPASSAATWWLLTAVVAIGPAIMLLHFSRELPQTTSQRIHNARR